MLSGVSVDYYVRLERGNLAGASASVLDALANTLKLDDAEREHLFDLARASGPERRPLRTAAGALRPAVQQVLDVIDSPAWVRNGRFDVIAMNSMGRALYAPMIEDSRGPLNTARFAYLNPRAREFFRDHDQVLNDSAAMLRMEAGRTPHDPELIRLIGELSTQSGVFRERWASQDVKEHRSGRKRLHHPVVGDLDLDYEALELPGDPGLRLNVYTAPAGSPTADSLAVLASWAATRKRETTPPDGAASSS